MKIKILASASQDLIDGYWFYEKQAEGLGIYFWLIRKECG
jgi:hypothetical protein